MTWQASDIGQLYDVGLATRDGATLDCRDATGNLVPVSMMAYMCSVEKGKTMKEATELQEKARLTQLGTSTSIDREFDQWVQNTQGDWSGGAGQRVYGQQSIINQYFDGEGILWPLNDYIPQKAMPGPTLGLPAAFSSFPFNALAGGYVNNGGQGYASIAKTTVPTWRVYFQTGDTTYSAALLGAPVNFTPVDLTIGGGFIWLLYSAYPGINGFVIEQYGIVNGVLVGIRSDTLTVASNGRGPVTGTLAASYIANKLYVAVATSSLDSAGGTTWDNRLYLLDYTAPGVPPGLGTPFALPSAVTATAGTPGTPPYKITEVIWSGSSLFVAVSDGFNASVLSLVSPYTAITETAVLPGLANAYMTTVGSILFIVGVTFGANSQVNRMDLFTLNGGQLTEFGNVSTPVPILDSVTSPTTFGGYAIWAVSYTLPGASTKTITVYAFDVVRSRLFRVLSFTAPGFTGSDIFGRTGVAVFGTTTRTLQAGVTFTAQWGISLFTGLISNNVETAREFYFGVVPLTPAASFTGLLQAGVDIVSGIFDFTAASKKLFRQIQIQFQGGITPQQAVSGVTVNAWLDENPDQLDSSPQFTATTPIVASGGLQQLSLVINKVARKLVYEVIGFAPPIIAPIAGPVYTFMFRRTQANSTVAIMNAGPSFVGASIGDLVSVLIYYQGPVIDATTTVVDTKGNVYVLDKQQAYAAGGVMIWHSVLTAALIATVDFVTVNFKNAGVNTAELGWIDVIRIQGVPNALFDRTAGASGNSVAADSGATAAIGVAAEAMVGIVGSTVINQHIAAGSGWTDLDHVAFGPAFSTLAETQTSAAIAGYDATGTLPSSGPWVAAIATYKPAINSWITGPKIISVIIQAATGWVWDFVFDLAPGSKTNSNNAPAYSNQSDPTTNYTIDQVVAYNFLKQLWRLRGGECIITLPNGDTYPALLQLLEFESPKPFAVSARSDQPTQWQEFVTVKIREDI